MACQRPVFLHDADGAFHAALFALLDDGLEIIGSLDGSGIKVLAGRVLDRVGIVDDAAGLDADRESVGLAVDRDCLRGIGHPVLIAQIQRVLGCQRVDVLGVNHGDGVGLIRGIPGCQMCGNGIRGIVDLYRNSLLLGILGRLLLELVLDLHLGVEDGDAGAALTAAVGAAGCGTAAAACQKSGCQHCSKCSGSGFPEMFHHRVSSLPGLRPETCPSRAEPSAISGTEQILVPEFRASPQPRVTCGCRVRLYRQPPSQASYADIASGCIGVRVSCVIYGCRVWPHR